MMGAPWLFLAGAIATLLLLLGAPVRGHRGRWTMSTPATREMGARLVEAAAT
jgi:hypothetical protein